MRIEVIKALEAALKTAGTGRLQPATGDDIKRAKEAGFPNVLIELYTHHEPDNYVELDHRLWSIENALTENLNAVPGVSVFPHGYVVFASTLSGDAYCIDTNVKMRDGQHPVVIFAHDSITEDADESYIQASRLEVASSLEDFITKFTQLSLVKSPLYPP